MDNILTGSASWTDKTLIECGRFYPKGCNSAEARLRHYATQFPLVEVDSSYYGMPSPANAQLWAERTPEQFTFNVKSFRLFTGHQTSPDVLHKDLRQALGHNPPATLYYKDTPREIADELWRRFSEALEPLRQAGKLGAVHFQFAPWLLRNREGMAHVEHCVEKMEGHLLSVEFRNKSWFDGENAQRTLEFERALGVVHTIVDGPQGFTNSVPDVWEATHPQLALLRLHGRNHDAWNIRSNASSSRFNYWYSKEEMAALVPKVRQVASLADSLHVVFNTNYEDQGQVNAKLLMDLLR
ncbi:MAG: DUF72 domain-containing protein [Pseudomonadota bacterium]